MLRTLSAVAVLLSLPVVLPLGAQQTSTVPPTAGDNTAPFTFHANVTLVTLDGVALDASGNIVRDLKQSDFHVSEDGVAQNVRYFAVPGENQPAPDVTINSSADLEHLAPRAPVTIFVLDEFSTHFEDMAFARYSLKKWLESQPDKLDSPAMIVAVDLRHFTVVRDYTQNKNDLLQALDKHFGAYPWASTNLSWASEEVAIAYNTLRRVAEATEAHAGHKNVLWLGRGFPLIHHTTTGLDHTNSSSHTPAQLAVDEMRAARVTLYTIDPAGVMIEPTNYASNNFDIEPFGGSPGFERLAQLTGGFGIHGRNDVDTQIGTTVRDGLSLYSLTYSPTNPTGESNEFRKIKVTIDRPGVTFLTHRGYYPAEKPARPRVDGSAGSRLSAELENAANTNMAYDAVAFSALATTSDPHVVVLHVQSKGLAYYITHDNRPRYTRVIVLARTTDAKGKQLWQEAKMYEFTAPPSVDGTGHLDLPVTMALKLPDDPKAVHVRFIVRVEASGHMGSAEMDLAPGAVAQSVSFTPGPEAAALQPSVRAGAQPAAVAHP